MNILARILSHGFAIAVVLLLASVFIYRGELFPGMPMPAFLGIERQDTAEHAAAGDTEISEDTDTAGAPVMAEVQPPPAPQEAAGEVTETAIPALESAAGAARQPEAPIPAPAAEAPVAESVPEAAADATPAAPAGAEQVPGIPAAAESATEAEIPVPVPAEATPDDGAVTPAAPAGAGQVPGIAPPPGMTEPDAGAEIPVPVPAESATAAADETASAVTEGVEASGSEPAAPEAVAEPPVPGVPPVDVQPESSLSGTAAEAATPMKTPAVESLTETAPPSAATDMPAPDMVAAVEPPSYARKHKPDLDMTRPYHVLAAAREAYWLHDHQEAESLYRQLIALDPDNPDGYGELGNLYFTQGKWDEAASAYFEAGSRLARSGHIMEAENLLDVIRGLEDPRADELADIIARSR
jgi:hypothetical protein